MNYFRADIQNYIPINICICARISMYGRNTSGLFTYSMTLRIAASAWYCFTRTYELIVMPVLMECPRQLFYYGIGDTYLCCELGKGFTGGIIGEPALIDIQFSGEQPEALVDIALHVFICISVAEVQMAALVFILAYYVGGFWTYAYLYFPVPSFMAAAFLAYIINGICRKIGLNQVRIVHSAQIEGKEEHVLGKRQPFTVRYIRTDYLADGGNAYVKLARFRFWDGSVGERVFLAAQQP